MSQLRVLHITPWFPLSADKMEGVFILEHIQALSKHCTNHVLHASFSEEQSVKQSEVYEGVSVDRVLLKPLLNRWRYKEVLIERHIRKYLAKHHQQYTHVNFYIAYPNAININRYIRQFPAVQFSITEHWSAYHHNFSLKKGDKGRNRIENIFNNTVPVFTVSSALGEDIRAFIGNPNRKFDIIPNTISPTEFPFKSKDESDTFLFLSLNSWSKMKNPFVLINAIEHLHKKYPGIRLKLVGNGTLVPEMKEAVAAKELGNVIEIKDRVRKEKVAALLQNANVYCQSSHYETFSVICIEALSTGTPVLATNIGGMKDFISDENGQLVNDLEVDSWIVAMEKAYLNYKRFDLKAISENCHKKFAKEQVGELFYQKLKHLSASNHEG